MEYRRLGRRDIRVSADCLGKLDPAAKAAGQYSGDS